MFTATADKDNPREVDRKYGFSTMSDVNLSLFCQLGVLPTPNPPLFIDFFFIILWFDRDNPWPGPVSDVMGPKCLVVSLKEDLLPATETLKTKHEWLETHNLL